MHLGERFRSDKLLVVLVNDIALLAQLIVTVVIHHCSNAPSKLFMVERSLILPGPQTKADLFANPNRRRHQLSDCVEHNLELTIVLAFKVIQSM